MNIQERGLHRYEGNPIITPKDFPGAYGTFNCGQIMYKGKTILLVPIQKMDDQVPAIHIAESTDGIHFDIHPDPFIVRSKDPAYHELDHWVIDPRVTYIAEDDYYYIMRPMNSSWGVVTMLCRTRDFETYDEMGIVALPHNRVPCLFPEKIDGKYVRLDRPYNGGGPCTGDIWISYSDDLMHWGGYKPLIKPWTNWGGGKIGPTPPIKTKEGWLEIIHGVKPGQSNRYSLGAVLLDLEDPSKVIAKAMSPILTPNTDYEYQGHVGGVVFACGAIADEEKDEIRVYYGAADNCIGLATGKLSEIIELCKQETKNFDEWRWS